jgi:hypothetical protein
MKSLTSLRTTAAMLLSLSTAAWAANSISVGTATANVGDAVTIPVLIDTNQPLTLLSVDITTDPALCGMIESEAIVKGGAANKAPEEGGEMCPTARVVLFDLSGNAVVNAGSGVVAGWALTVRPDGAGGVFPLRLTVNQARNGPAPPVRLTPVSGQLTLVAQGGQPAIGVAPPPAPAVGAPVEPQVGAPVEPGTQSAPAGGAPVGPGGAAKGAAAGGSAVTEANPPGAPPPPGSEESGGGVTAPEVAGKAGEANPVPATAIPPKAAVTSQAQAAPATATPATAPSPALTNTVAPRLPTPTRTVAATATQAAPRAGSCSMSAVEDRQQPASILLIPLLVFVARRLRAARQL